jgi:hypothetical protein
MSELLAPISEGLLVPIDRAVPSGVTHIGFVATNIQGDFLITEPKGHKYGTSATFSKVKVKDGEKPHETLYRCIREQIGQSPTGIYPIPAIWITSNARQFYFAGMLDLSKEYLPSTTIPGLRWSDFDEAERLINRSQNVEFRKRDLGLLSAASGMCLFPGRRMLLMVRELHLMGFERLRAPAYCSGAGYWRCPIIPASWTWREHGGMCEELLFNLKESFGPKRPRHTYTSGDGQRPFEWEGVQFAEPRELALRFVKEQPEIALAGWGPDLAYVQWFQNTLELIAPNGIFYSCSSTQGETDRLYTLMTSIEEVRLPPPGCTNREEFEKFASRQGQTSSTVADTEINVPDVEMNSSTRMTWEDVAPIIDIYTITADNGEKQWFQRAWAGLEKAGLTRFEDEIGRHWALMRAVTLGIVYNEFAQCAWDHFEDSMSLNGVLYDSLDQYHISPASIAQLTESAWDDEDNEEVLLSFDEIVLNAVSKCRKPVYDALLREFGDDGELFLSLWISPDPPPMYLRTGKLPKKIVEEAFKRQSALEYIFLGMSGIF